MKGFFFLAVSAVKNPNGTVSVLNGGIYHHYNPTLPTMMFLDLVLHLESDGSPGTHKILVSVTSPEGKTHPLANTGGDWESLSYSVLNAVRSIAYEATVYGIHTFVLTANDLELWNCKVLVGSPPERPKE